MKPEKQMAGGIIMKEKMLDGKVAVVSGASYGMGQTMAQRSHRRIWQTRPESSPAGQRCLDTVSTLSISRDRNVTRSTRPMHACTWLPTWEDM